MLIRKEYVQPAALLGIWEMTESREELLSNFPHALREEALYYLKGIRSNRRAIEWLSTRLMVFHLLDEKKIILKREDGSPYIKDDNLFISISHTRNFAAILLHPNLPVGVDIETRSERVNKIAEKFIASNEYIDPEQKTLHQLLHWSAKESLFKLIGLKGIDFKEHLHITPFTPKGKGEIQASETRSESRHVYSIHYEVHPQYVLTWTIG